MNRFAMSLLLSTLILSTSDCLTKAYASSAAGGDVLGGYAPAAAGGAPSLPMPKNSFSPEIEAYATALSGDIDNRRAAYNRDLARALSNVKDPSALPHIVSCLRWMSGIRLPSNIGEVVRALADRDKIEREIFARSIRTLGAHVERTPYWDDLVLVQEYSRLVDHLFRIMKKLGQDDVERLRGTVAHLVYIIFPADKGRPLARPHDYKTRAALVDFVYELQKEMFSRPDVRNAALVELGELLESGKPVLEAVNALKEKYKVGLEPIDDGYETE